MKSFGWIHRTGVAVACAFTLAAPGMIPGVVQAATVPVPTPQLVYPQMPSGFNPMTATSAQLAHYGLPPRPPASNAAVLASWTNAMKHAKQEVASVAVQGVPMGGYNGNNYAGYYSSQVNNGNIPYEQVAGNWTVPTVPSDGSTNEVGSWVGIGGILSGGKDELQQAGVISIASSPPSYRFFWENYSSDGSSPVLQGPTVTGGIRSMLMSTMIRLRRIPCTTWKT